MKDRGQEGLEILLLRFSSLGDVVLATSAVRNLRAVLPEARITVVTKGIYAPLLAGNPRIERVMGFGPPGGRGDLAELIRLCRRLGPFDVVADLHSTPRSRLASRLVPSRQRLRYRKKALQRRLWALGWMRESMRRDPTHVVERYLSALEPLGVKEPAADPEIFLDGNELLKTDRFLRRAGIPDPRKTAVLVPGARWPNKRWTVEGFAAVGKWLVDEKGMHLVVIGDGGDRPCVEELMSRLPAANSTDVAGETNLRQMAALLHLAAIAIGNDSGPGHVAAAVGTPVVTLFGPTSEAYGFSPRGERARTVSMPLSCRPCSIHGGNRCPRGRRACLDDLSAEPVIAAARSLLEGG